MKVSKSDRWRVTGDEVPVSCARCGSCHASLVTRHSFAFTLIEMLVVIAILGLIAGLAVPALKNLGKSDATVSAARQLLDDIGRARQLAMSQRTTVYMVFVPTNFWGNLTYNSAGASTAWFNSLSPNQTTAVTNLCDNQLTGYAFIGRGTVGDQPGRHNWRYLSSWQNLPAGTYIAPQKFDTPNQQLPIAIDSAISAMQNKPIYGFGTNSVPFPVETNSVLFLNMPCLVFNSFGHLLDQNGQILQRHEYIPLARGSIAPAVDATTKTYQLGSPSVLEIPPGNSTNISANIIDIDPLTGRAVLRYYKMGP
ncbi:MAG: prepilin-type N-terminal cleavage/methylation domain-containing protein [Verrucomicrobiales bacterium]|nr:prepilin-type N-terminal cleavage/methylation domain-containing protein [Verrucomicrobiales bacterium]